MSRDRDEEEQAGRGFKVRDRRRFLDPSNDEQTPDEPEPAAAEPPPVPEPGPAPSAAREEHARGEVGPMTFSTFIMGLTTQALMHLGEIVDPQQQQPGRDLAAARQMIDLLGILQDKTRGNLDSAEQQLLDDMLYDLRMRYVEVSRGA